MIPSSTPDALNSPFVPQAGANIVPNPSPDQQADIAKEWRGFLADPRARSALLQFGLSMMQPVGLGQTPIGAAAQAVGSGGEAVARIDAADLNDEKVRAQAEARRVAAEAAQTRAEAATARSGEGSARLDLARERLGYQRDTSLLNRKIQASIAYQRYTTEANKAKIFDPKAPPPMPVEEFYSKFGFGDLLPGATPGATTETPGPSGDTPAATEGQPPVPGARKAANGNWYIPDPKRPGKYLMVQP